MVVVSVAALGAGRLRQRALDTALELVGAVLAAARPAAGRTLPPAAGRASAPPPCGSRRAGGRGPRPRTHRPGRPGPWRRLAPAVNAATAATVVLGVVSLYLALWALTLAGAGLLITPDALSQALAAEVGLVDYLKLAWFVSSLATVGGALGAGLETDVAVREAAYAYRGENESSNPGDLGASHSA